MKGVKSRFFAHKIILVIFISFILTQTFGENNTLLTTLSPDNPVIELIDAELSGNRDASEKAIRIIDTLLNEYKRRLSKLSKKRPALSTIVEQCNIFYLILNSSITISEEVRLLTDGLLRDQPQRDCDIGCLLFLIAGYEFDWPMTVYLGEQKGKSDKTGHALLQVRVFPEKFLFFETTNGKWYSSLDKISNYNYNFICITGEQLYGIFYTVIAANHLENNDISRAIVCLQKAIDCNTTQLDEAFFTLGIAYVKCKEYAKAIEAFEQSLELSPGDSRTLKQLLLSYHQWGEDYFQNKEYREAVSVYERGLQRFPDSRELREELLSAYMYAAYYYLVIKEYKKAVDTAQQAVEIAPAEIKQEVEVFYEDLLELILYKYEKGEE